MLIINPPALTWCNNIQKKTKMAKIYPKNSYKQIGITDKEFREAIREDRNYRKKKYGSINIFR